jgi:GT2 family glycosyltransferase
MRFCFVSTRRGSYFMTELLAAISSATAAAGHVVDLVFDEFPRLAEETIYIVIPHEFRAWGDPNGCPDSRQRARTIALCTENPGTDWFEATYELVPQFAAVMSINRSSAAELQRRGIRCEHLQLGYSPSWDVWLRDASVERHIDMLYLGAADPRRNPLLGGLGGSLWARECQLLIPPLEPRTRPRPDFLKGAEKYHRLRSAKILLNLHRTTSSALEWMRFLEAICNGCVVVSEPCLDNEPLTPGVHFVAASTDNIAVVVDDLLDDPCRLQQLRERAYDFVREELPMVSAGVRLAELAAELPRQPPAGDSRFGSAPLPAHRQPDAPPPREPRPDLQQPPVGVSPSALSTTGREPGRLRQAIHTHVLRGRRSGVRVLAQTPAYARITPRVSVVSVVADSREGEDIEALASVAASLYDELELLILDRASGGAPGLARRSFLDERPSLPAMLLHQSVNGGLGQSLNTLAERARGEYLFILNPEGGIYPSTLGRLVTALDADPRAIFSYPMVAVFDGLQPVELLSSLPWERERLKSGNWIDAIALLRRKRLLELGGYCTDPRLAGWEDYELWCKCAAAGGHGVHVPQVLAWHRQSADRGTPDMWALMRMRFPQLLDDADGV